MKGDFSRLRFEPKQHYTSVLQQQGRVQLDQDGNEQRAIDEHLRRTETRDVIGEEGAPVHHAGFAITADASGIGIGPGRYYAGGLLCENEAQLAYADQPFLVGVSPNIATLLADLAAGRSAALEVWLEAWQRVATPIDDPCLREPALGEADTTLRLQTVWRVHALPRAASQATTGLLPANEALAGAEILQVDCCTRMRRTLKPIEIAGKLSARTLEDPGQGSCLPSPSAAYRGLENQLYRVEIHAGGPAGQASYKWSRENGSVVARVTQVSGATLTLDTLGPDATLGFAPEQWVEILDDGDEFGGTPNQPGTLARIQTTDPAHRTITLYTTAPSVDTSRGHARVRRWDQTRADASAAGLPCAPGVWQELENGIEICFAADGSFKPGDYWLIPARTATGDIEWPPCGSDGDAFQAPHRIEIVRAALACIHFDGQKRGFVVQDCRRLFSPLTELDAPPTPPALHVTGIGWKNDEVMAFDQLAFNGLSVTFDKAPDMPVDARNLIVTLEVLLPVGGAGEVTHLALTEARSISRGIGAVRSALIIDGTTQLSGNTLTWTVPRALWLYLDQILNVGLDLASAGLLARARVVLKSHAVAQGSGAGALYLDGQCFTNPATRADGSARLDLQFPSGNAAKASDFESWFDVAPVQLITALTLAPASVALVRDPASGAAKLVDNGSGQPSPTAPAVQPTGTVTLNYAALADTAVALAVTNAPTQNIVSVPASVTIARGASEASFNIGVTGNPGATATKFDISATINAPGGLRTSQTSTFTVTGFAATGGGGINIAPGLFNDALRNIANPTNKPGG